MKEYDFCNHMFKVDVAVLICYSFVLWRKMERQLVMAIQGLCSDLFKLLKPIMQSDPKLSSGLLSRLLHLL